MQFPSLPRNRQKKRLRRPFSSPACVGPEAAPRRVIPEKLGGQICEALLEVTNL